jgi:membrane-associated phospholipid phosphatase
MIVHNYLGFFGPYILTIINIFYIFHIQEKFFFLYIISHVINIVLNIILKNIIKDPRPSDEKSFLDVERLHMDKYGMPSGHAQTAWYNVGIIMLNKVPIYIKILSIIIACLTIYQRYIYKNHTVIQLVVGMIIGLLLAYISNYVIKQYDYKCNSPVL